MDPNYQLELELNSYHVSKRKFKTSVNTIFILYLKWAKRRNTDEGGQKVRNVIVSIMLIFWNAGTELLGFFFSPTLSVSTDTILKVGLADAPYLVGGSQVRIPEPSFLFFL